MFILVFPFALINHLILFEKYKRDKMNHGTTQDSSAFLMFVNIFLFILSIANSQVGVLSLVFVLLILWNQATKLGQPYVGKEDV